MKNIFQIVFLLFLLSSCNKLKSIESKQDKYVIDTTIYLSEKYNNELNQEFSEKEAENILYRHFKRKGIFSQSSVKGDMSENEEQFFVDYDTIYRFPSNKSLAIITYYLAPAYLNGHCVQPKRAMISSSKNILKVINEEFIPENFLIDSIDQNSTIFISDYDCANKKVLKKYRLKLK